MSFSTISITERFSQSIDGLWRAVAAMSAGRRLEAAMIMLICGRIRRIETRFLALVAAIRAGRDRGGWVIQKRVARTQVAPRATCVSCVRLPRRFAWLIVLVPYHAAGFASQLRHVLGDPEMVALLAASPRLGKMLQPLGRMLGIEPALLSPVAAAVDSNVGACGATKAYAAVTATDVKSNARRSAPAVEPGGGVELGHWFYRMG